MPQVRLEIDRFASGGVQYAGDVVDVSADEARVMIERCQAVPVRDAVTETAMRRPQPERATKRKGV